VATYERHTAALRIPVGDVGHKTVRTCRPTVLPAGPECRRKRRDHDWKLDIIQSERKVAVSAQSQVSATVRTVSRRTRQL